MLFTRFDHDDCVLPHLFDEVQVYLQSFIVFGFDEIMPLKRDLSYLHQDHGICHFLDLPESYHLNDQLNKTENSKQTKTRQFLGEN